MPKHTNTPREFQPRPDNGRVVQAAQTVIRIHSHGPLTGNCTECREPYPCQTVTILREALRD